MKRSTKKFVLQELADYKENCMEIIHIQEQIKNLSCSGKAEITNRELQRLFLRQEYLERAIAAIDDLRETLNEDLLLLFNEKFLRKPSLQDKTIIAHLNVSRAKFYKDLDLICKMLADRLGLS